MNHVLVTLIVLASSGAAAPVQDQGALQRDRRVLLARESTSSKNSPSHRLTPSIGSGHCSSSRWA